jgi:uncharacterized protein (DUF1697 family)
VETYVALLRSINLGSHNRIPMKELAVAMEELGFGDVQTYLQSGNAVFRANSAPIPELKRKLRDMVKQRFGHDVGVIVRTAAEMKATLDGNPFLSRPGIDATRLHVTLLTSAAPTSLVDRLDPKRGGNDEWQITGKDVFLYCPNGYGNTKLTNKYFEQMLDTSATTRNWKTITALNELIVQ